MRGMYRSRSAKRRNVKAVKRTVTHFKKKQKGLHVCAECGAFLHGVRDKGRSKTRNTKTSRPSRKYGGYLCHRCLRKKIVRSVRA